MTQTTAYDTALLTYATLRAAVETDFTCRECGAPPGEPCAFDGRPFPKEPHAPRVEDVIGASVRIAGEALGYAYSVTTGDPFVTLVDDVDAHICGACGKPPLYCDHVWCGIHRVWSRDNGGRLVGCPGICDAWREDAA